MHDQMLSTLPTKVDHEPTRVCPQPGEVSVDIRVRKRFHSIALRPIMPERWRMAPDADLVCLKNGKFRDKPGEA
jgi:hypothetical protein